MADFCGLGGVAEWLNAPVLKTYNYSLAPETSHKTYLIVPDLYHHFGNFWQLSATFFYDYFAHNT